MADLQRSIDIPAPPEAVFQFLASQWETSLDFWAAGIEDWRAISSPPLGEGFQVEYVGRILGVGMKVRMEVRDFRPGRGWTANSMAGPPVRGVWRFDPLDGGTRFTYRLVYRMPPPLLGPLMDRLFVARQWASAIEASLANLQANFAEGPPESRSEAG